MIKTKCKACGVKWTDHIGISRTCGLLQIAMTTLDQIASTPRNAGARRNALATLAFIESLKPKIKAK